MRQSRRYKFMQTPYHVQILQKVTTFLNETKVPVNADLVKEFEEFFRYVAIDNLSDDELDKLIANKQKPVQVILHGTPTENIQINQHIENVNKIAALTHAQQGAKNGIKIG